jgi:hypothetical protein
MKKQVYTHKGGASPVLLFSYYCLFGFLLVFTAGTPVYSESNFSGSTKLNSGTLPKADIVIKGNVTDEKGLPLPGASVKVRNGAGATVTDTNGNFVLNVPDAGTVLQISFTGYEAREVTASAESLKIQLQPGSKVLNEVVVVGYGTSKKANLTNQLC